MSELFLYAASRSQHVEEVIAPSLDRGDVVVCDRYIASSLAYQGYGRGLNLEEIEQINRLAVGECLPDATIYLILPVEVAWRRLGRRDHRRSVRADGNGTTREGLPRLPRDRQQGSSRLGF